MFTFKTKIAGNFLCVCVCIYSALYSGVTTILHVYSFLLTWNFLALLASSPLIGTISTMTASPAKTDGPNSSHRKAMDRMICRGQDHSRWMKLVTSLKRWASADIRFTVSPTVDSLRASLETTSALGRGWRRDCRERGKWSRKKKRRTIWWELQLIYTTKKERREKNPNN